MANIDELEVIWRKVNQSKFLPVLEIIKKNQLQIEIESSKYTLIDTFGENPNIIFLGYCHGTKQKHEKERIRKILAKIVKPGDIITAEGASHDCRDQKDLEFICANEIPHTNFRARFNDSVRDIVLSRINETDYFKSKITKQEYISFQLNNLLKRDTNFCNNAGRGLIQLHEKLKYQNYGKQKKNKIIQLIGAGHLASGTIRNILRSKNVSYQMYVSNENITHNKLRELSDPIYPNSIKEDWVCLLGELGYVGKKNMAAELDQKYGFDKWVRAFFHRGNIIHKEEALVLYEQSYYDFLKDNDGVREWLINTASEVYDIQPSNINSGLDYSIQECSGVHFQDISVRRVLKRLGLKFKGNHLVQIRGYDSEGYVLNPGQVPFHNPEEILDKETKTWWKPNSIEAFYQHNKALLIDPNSLVLAPVIEGPEGTYFALNKSVYYLQDKENPTILYRKKGKNVRSLLHKIPHNHRQIEGEAQPYSIFLRKS